MSRALVVFESMYGNNQQIAAAITEGIRAAGLDAECVEVGSAPTTLPDDVGLLVAGCPNHAAGMPRGSDRESAAKRSDQPLVSQGITLREWFDQLERGRQRVPAAAWDTRLAKPRFLRWFDRAASGVEKRLRKHGFEVRESSEHFYVTEATGPLAGGELDRAHEWGKRLAKLAAREPATA